MSDVQGRRAPQPTPLWHIFTVGWLVPALLMTARVDPGFGLLGIVALYGALLGLIWLVCGALVLLSREARARLTRRAVAAWLAFPAMVLLVALLLHTRWPLMLRVRLSEPALLELVQEARADRRPHEDPRRAGLMFVDHVYAEEDCVFLHTNHGFIFREHGLAYSPDGSEPRGRYMGYRTEFHHLTGHWWTFEASD